MTKNNTKTQKTTPINLIVTVHSIITDVVSFSDGPHITFRPGTSLQVLEHSSLTLRCDVNANPQVTSVQWFVGGVRQQGEYRLRL